MYLADRQPAITVSGFSSSWRFRIITFGLGRLDNQCGADGTLIQIRRGKRHGRIAEKVPQGNALEITREAVFEESGGIGCFVVRKATD